MRADNVAVIADTAVVASTQAANTVRVFSGAGKTLTVISVMTPSVPHDPAISLHKSYPVTFFTTRPPDLNNSPRPETAATPEMIARRTRLDTSRSRQAAGNYAAQRSRVCRCANKRTVIRRLECQHLTMLVELHP